MVKLSIISALNRRRLMSIKQFIQQNSNMHIVIYQIINVFKQRYDIFLQSYNEKFKQILQKLIEQHNQTYFCNYNIFPKLPLIFGQNEKILNVTIFHLNEKKIINYNLMQERVQAIKKLFRDNGCLDDFDNCTIQQIAHCNDLKILDSIIHENQISREDYYEDLKGILFKNSKNQASQMALKNVTDLKDLLRQSQELRNNQTIFSYKHIKLLQLEIFIKNHPEIEKVQHVETKNIVINIQQNIAGLRQSLKKEGKITQNIQQNLRRIQNSASLEDISSALRRIKKEVMVIDIDRLFCLISKSQDVLSTISHQGGIVFIGLTGSGKSTTIQTCLGNEMVLGNWNGRKCIIPKKMRNVKGIESIIACPSVKSVTRNVAAVELPKDMIDGFHNQSIFLIDTPGFKDTEGSLIDLSNSQGTVKAIRSLNSARFVAMFSQKDEGSRFQGFIDMAETFNQIFPKYEDIKNSILFFFNRYKLEDIKEFNNNFRAICEQLPEHMRLNNNIINIFNDFKQKTKNLDSIILFDPLNQSVQYARNHVSKILRCPAAKNLDYNFSILYTQNSKKDIDKQASIFRELCLFYFKIDDLDTCKYFLLQIHKFIKIFGNFEVPESIPVNLNHIKQQIISTLKGKYNNIVQIFNKAIDINLLQQSDVETYLTQIKDAKKYDFLKQFFQFEDFENRLTSNALDKIVFLIQTLKQNLRPVDQKTIESLRILLNAFKKQTMLSDVKQFYKSKLDDIKTTYTKLIQSMQFNQSADLYIKFKKTYETYCMLSPDQRNQIPPINLILTQRMTNRTKSISQILQNFADISEQEIKLVKQVALFLRKIEQSDQYLRVVDNHKFILEMCKKFNENISSKVQIYFKQIQQYLQGKTNLQSGVIKQISKFYRQKDEMKEIPQLKALVTEKSNSITNKIRICLQNQKIIQLAFIDSIKDKRVNYNDIKRKVYRLDQAAKSIQRILQLHKNEEYQVVLYETSQKLKQFFDDNLGQIREIYQNKLDYSKEQIGQQMQKLRQILQLLLAFDFADEKQLNIKFQQDHSKLLQNDELIKNYKLIKDYAEKIFSNTIRDIKNVSEKLAKMRKEKEDNPSNSYHNIKLKEVELCLKFLEMGMKIFNAMPEKQKQFMETQRDLQNEMLNWERVYTQQISDELGSLKNSESSEISIKNLKKKINLLNEIKNKHHQIHKIFEQNDRKFLSEQLQEKVNQLYQNTRKKIEKNSKLQNFANQIISIMQKCKILSWLDVYLDSNNNFVQLQSQCRKRIQKQADTLEKKFAYALKFNSYEDIAMHLSAMNQNQPMLYEQCQSQLITHLKTKNNEVINRKKKGLKCVDEIQPTIQILGSLIEAKKALSNSQICKQNQIMAIIREISETANSLSQNIKQQYNKKINSIQTCIQKFKIEEAFSLISDVQNIEKILQGTEAQKNIENSKISTLRYQIQKIIQQYANKYVKAEKIDFSKFRDDYDQVFDAHITSDKLLKLKKQILKKVDRQISETYMKMEQQTSFTRQKLTRVKQFLSQLPIQLQEKKNSDNLLKDSEKKYQKWDLQKKNINQKAQNYDIFNNGGYINPKILDFFNDNEADVTIKQVLLNKLNIQLENKSKYQNTPLSAYLKLLISNQQLNLPKTHYNYPPSELHHSYQKIQKEIQIRIQNIVTQSVKSIQKKISPNNIHHEQENEINDFKIFIADMVDSLHLIQGKLKSKFNFKDLSPKIIFILEKSVEKILRQHFKLKAEVKDMKKSTNIFSEQFMEMKQQIQKVKYLRNIENYITIFDNMIKQDFRVSSAPSNSNVSVTILSFESVIQKIQRYKKQFCLNEYIKQVQQNILVRHNDFLKFSLKSNRFDVLSTSQIKQQFKQIIALARYQSCMLIMLLKSLGIKQGQAKVIEMTSHYEKIFEQAQQFKMQILEFSSNPILSDDKIDEIRRKLTITEALSEQNSRIQKVRSSYQKQLKEYHNKLFNFIINQITQLLNNQSQHLKEAEVRKITLQKQIKSYSENLKKESNEKLNKLQQQHKINMQANQDGEQKLKLESSYKIDKQTLKLLLKQQIQQNYKVAAQNFLKFNDDFQQMVKQKFKQIAKTYQKMVSITILLMPTIDNKQRNDHIISNIKQKGKKKWLKYLVDSLNLIGSTTSGIIISSNYFLKSLSETHFKKNIQSIDIREILQKFKGENTQIDSKFCSVLEKRYFQFNKTYKVWINQYGNNTKCKQKLIDELLKCREDKDDTQKHITLLAQIYALWNIITSIEDEGQITYIYQPHAAQVVTSIILLGLPEIPLCEGFKNRFAQIQTGQGKSLVLAVVATFFALHNYEVDCVCYSENLSQRDKQTFNDLFQILKITKKIKYCTFNNLTQRFVSSKQINLRKQCVSIIKTKVNKNQQKQNISLKSSDQKSRGKVLLMDEADVFFIDQFYGNTFTPVVEIKSQKIKQLYHFIWSSKDDKKMSKNFVEHSQEYKQVIQQFPQLQPLIKNHIPYMINGARNHRHDYQVLDGKIAYKDQDGYSNKISYGYKTIFAYFYEYFIKTINELPSCASSIQIRLCEISYAELPKMYNFIVGVTGTLKNLSKCKLEIMQKQYNIYQKYIIPSIYLQSKREDKGHNIVDAQKHFQEIVKNAKQVHATGRPIIIFFAALQDVNKFYQFDLFKQFQKNTVVLTEKCDAATRKIMIIRAMGQGKITLMTKAFSRGIDFIIYENNVIKLGGGHLIVGYAIDEKSEQIQIMGRVARQGDPGSSIFIITKQDLENKLDMKSSVIQECKSNIQINIDESRQRKMFQKQKIIDKQILQASKSHKQTQNLLKNIQRKQNQTIFETILKFNMLPQWYGQNPVKTILAIDGTASMANALLRTRISLAQTFPRVYNILEQHKVCNGFQVQIAVYRNYNVKQDELLITTPFQRTPQQLISFVEKIQPYGGWKNEALEVLYDHCLEVEDLKQIILITDAKANTFEETKLKRENKVYGYGQHYWAKTTKFKKALNSQQMLMKLKQKNIVINTLPIGRQQIVKYYETISHKTLGKSQKFDPKYAEASTQLTNFISTSILSQLGGEDSDLGNQLVQSYKKAYKV